MAPPVLAPGPLAGDPHAAALQRAGIDPSVIVARLGGNAALLPEVCALLRDQLPQLLSALDTAFAQGDGAAVAAAAHVLKGAISNFTDGPLWERARAIEGYARLGDLAAAAGPLPMLRADLQALLAALLAAGLRS
jgi:hypothetical protein